MRTRLHFPLIAASGGGYLSIVNALIKNGAKVNTTRKDGAHAAFMAAQKGHLEILQLLVEKDPSVAYLKGFEGRQGGKGRDNVSSSSLNSD